MILTSITLIYSFVFLGMLYTFYKVGISQISILFVFIFWGGFVDYIDTIVGMGILNFYKSAIVVYAVILLWKSKVRFVTNKSDLAVNVTFLLFSLSYWISYSLYGGKISTILSQFLYKYSMIWFAYHYFKDITYNIPKREYLKHVLITILFVQIAVSIFKIFLLGFDYEGIVGSMSFGGGGPAVVIPIMAMIFYWLIRNGSFRKNDWIIIALILIIAIASGKRQPIIIYPTILLALFVFVSQSVRFSVLLKYLPIVLVFFYFGVRMTSTITPEGKAGGSFNITYVKNYVMKYYFGTAHISEIFQDNFQGTGRGAGFAIYFKPQMLSLESKQELLFGKGLYDVAINKYGRFTAGGDRSDYGIQHSGLMGEAGSLLYSIGYLGTLLMLLMARSIIFSIKNKRLAWIVFIYFLWDFLFYYNQMLFFNSSSLIVIMIIFYSNSIENERMLFIKQRLQPVNGNMKL